jgi:hypothetical protein
VAAACHSHRCLQMKVRHELKSGWCGRATYSPRTLPVRGRRPPRRRRCLDSKSSSLPKRDRKPYLLTRSEAGMWWQRESATRASGPSLSDNGALTYWPRILELGRRCDLWSTPINPPWPRVVDLDHPGSWGSSKSRLTSEPRAFREDRRGTATLAGRRADSRCSTRLIIRPRCSDLMVASSTRPQCRHRGRGRSRALVGRPRPNRSGDERSLARASRRAVRPPRSRPRRPLSSPRRRRSSASR